MPIEKEIEESFLKKLIENQKPLDSDIQEIINNNFWEYFINEENK